MDKLVNKIPRKELRYRLQMAQVLLLALAGLSACSQHQTVSADHGQRIKVTVGDIREISLARSTDTTLVLTGSSDNTEVVDVSQQAAPGNPMVFQIKGITLGTARVVFSEKHTGDIGVGKARKTYLVQVVGK